MEARDLSILNALVTFAAENIPGGLGADEQRVAKMVGEWALDPEPISQIRYRPIFSGHDEEARKVVFYQNVTNPNEIHVKKPNGDLWALSPGAHITWQHNKVDDDKVYVEVVSPEWTGAAVGTRAELLNEPGIRFI